MTVEECQSITVGDRLRKGDQVGTVISVSEWVQISWDHSQQSISVRAGSGRLREYECITKRSSK